MLKDYEARLINEFLEENDAAFNQFAQERYADEAEEIVEAIYDKLKAALDDGFLG